MGNFKRIFTSAVVLLLAFVALGCGDDETSSSTSAATEAGTASSSTTEADSDLAAIEITVKGWVLEGGCERMTDKFLEDQTFNDDPEEACKTFESLFSPPAYGEDDFDVTDITYENDKATATVESPGIDASTVYHLVFEDGVWKIDSADLK
jgi:hypothetical protein